MNTVIRNTDSSTSLILEYGEVRISMRERTVTLTHFETGHTQILGFSKKHQYQATVSAALHILAVLN